MVVTGDSGSNASRCADKLQCFLWHMHSGFPMEKVEQMTVMSLSDVTVIACAIGGKYIRKANLSFGAVIWVSGT